MTSDNYKTFGLIAAGILIFTAVIIAVTNCQPKAEEPKKDVVHFLAVGDNLPEESIGKAGLQSDGSYNYDFIYNNVKPYIQEADLSLITSETCLGGNNIGPKGWPSFNARDEIADSIQNAGFDVAALASNHSFDWWKNAASHNVDVWKKKNVTSLGMDNNQEDANKIRTKTVNGIKFAFLDYTYGVNAYEESDFNPWEINFFSEDKIKNDVSRARSEADVVVAFAHWGTERTFEVNDMQKKYGQLFADCGVDIVVGSHPHVIQPMTWYYGKGGNPMLMTYSLGNFNSNFAITDPSNQVEGMLKCDIEKTNNGINISNVRWVPLVNHNEEGNYTVYALKDYSEELAKRHPYLKSVDNPLEYIKKTTREIVNANGNNFIIEEVSDDNNSEDSERSISH